MSHPSFKSVFALAALLAVPSLAHAHYDFVPTINGSKIVTGGHDDELGIDTPSLRVAGYDFGEEPSDPYNIGDPGFNTGGASGFTAGSALRLAGASYQGSFLSYWNGVGEPAFTAAPANVSLTIAGSPTRRATFTAGSLSYAPTTDASVLIGSFASNGALHSHLGSSIFADGDQITGSVPVGAYLISFTLTNPGTGVADSEPLYVVFNNGLTEEQHDAAIDAVAAAVVPEPAALGAALPAAALLLLRRRR